MSWSEQVKTWVKRIPAGRVATYGQIAALSGHPRASRQVGTILRASQEDALPWHRVLNAQGEVSTWKLGVGDLQMARLEAEGIVFEAGKCDLKRFLWQPETELLLG
ncbi:cysteine methyltransferase [bacterium (Candidatus Blackallbacteria) CG17_big_fil_post_rev_8_21_14_2_50_48_46]|uniref:Cysteine methyltransferase n=1 Tax=bacterium (Candidatus Blackallbacteria) CG17_big_fil_post_rev_8_21_14_2_50_48_46 TaxID=2014261 RepID=A0A2M7FZT4_9BACT|nr:MAG: cysteine methyltransferase [bacterium (Candidatus Blackallbacteria) CG18_big_fil_WC_8_21_14_2_50_49_26]PIW14911.1 MAG: cysteine methyltransferase [bacterium (Candidatus Blackallbacteria) CG17_big_fil_post_rev_8_21_14_2_50_48_46]PIW44301.1 MAG: cysteine methyltransferase [bacterium (Candidatus Blackallbacteria) CG13_big_fil_rev_8_21_14_2_50_49_14]